MDYLLPLQPEGRVVGYALTVKFAPKRGTEKFEENLYSIIRKARAGEVLVIEALGTDCWILGENTVHAAKKQGMAGMVIDGRVRDLAEILKIKDHPVFCRGAAIRPHAPSLELVGYNIPVVCGGAQVRPGDAIVGDQDGVVVIPSERLQDIIVQAKDIEVLEGEQEEAIAQGKPLEELNEILRRKKQRK